MYVRRLEGETETILEDGGRNGETPLNDDDWAPFEGGIKKLNIINKKIRVESDEKTQVARDR